MFPRKEYGALLCGSWRFRAVWYYSQSENSARASTKGGMYKVDRLRFALYIVLIITFQPNVYFMHDIYICSLNSVICDVYVATVTDDDDDGDDKVWKKITHKLPTRTLDFLSQKCYTYTVLDQLYVSVMHIHSLKKVDKDVIHIKN